MMDGSLAEIKRINFVPAENEEQIRSQLIEWIKANGFMGLSEGSICSLERCDVGDIQFGDHKAYAALRLNFRTSSLYAPRHANTVEDPNGTWWRHSTLEVKVALPSFTPADVEESRRRIAVLDAVTTLAERLEAEFGSFPIWTQRSTKAEREACAAATQQAEMQKAVAGAVALECSNMRVGSERRAQTPANFMQGTYTVTRAGKTYTAFVTNKTTFRFVRTK